MIPGVVASMALSRKATLGFKGVAILTANATVQVFRDKGDSYEEVFSFNTFGVITQVKLVSDVLFLSGNNNIRVFTWDGATFNQTYSGNTGAPGRPGVMSTISFDSNRAMWWSTYNLLVETATKTSNGGYVREGIITSMANVACLATNGDGTFLFSRGTSNRPITFSRFVDGSWTPGQSMLTTNISSAAGQISSSQVGDMLYVAASSTISSVNNKIVGRYYNKDDDTWGAISIQSAPATNYNIMGVEVSYKGNYIIASYRIGTTNSGGVLVYKREPNDEFLEVSNFQFSTTYPLDVTMASDENKIFVSLAAPGGQFATPLIELTEQQWGWYPSNEIATLNNTVSRTNFNFKTVSAN